MKYLLLSLSLALSGCATTGAILKGMSEGAKEASAQMQQQPPIQSNYHHENCMSTGGGNFSCTQDY